MSVQDQLEKVLRELYITLSTSDVYDNEKNLVIIDKNKMIHLLTSLSKYVYGIKDEYELTTQSRDKAERIALKKREDILNDANHKAEDVYAASILYSDETLKRVQNIVQEAMDSMKNIFVEAEASLQEEKQIVHEDQSELRECLLRMQDTEKYMHIIEDQNKQLEKEKQIEKEKKTVPQDAQRKKPQEWNGNEKPKDPETQELALELELELLREKEILKIQEELRQQKELQVMPAPQAPKKEPAGIEPPDESELLEELALQNEKERLEKSELLEELEIQQELEREDRIWREAFHKEQAQKEPQGELGVQEERLLELDVEPDPEPSPYAALKPVIKINEAYFRAHGFALEDEWEQPDDEVKWEAPEIRVNLDSPYFKWKESSAAGNGIDGVFEEKKDEKPSFFKKIINRDKST